MNEPDPLSIGDDATFAGGRPRPSRDDLSLGDERTLGGGDAAGLDTVLDDIEIVELEARYTIEGTLGQGGMGAVVLATDTRLGRKVAIKRILGEAARSKAAIQRFLTEAKAIAALNHPNVVQIYDYGRAKDGPFLIMEYVDGGSLLDRCRDGALPLAEAIDLACQICDGLAKAHDLGIIHRDIKPANVLLTADGTPKLTDFGLAKAEAADHQMTMTGAVMGTPDFMPPEQRRDAAEVDHRSDLWSLAASVYQMVTGRSPKIIRFNDVPAALQDVLAKALEDHKDARYQSARELREALKTSLRAAATVVDELIDGLCPSCGAKNESSRRFCRGCGESLEAPCLACEKPMPMWEEICGSCGAKQTPLVTERRQAMAARQAEAEGALGDFAFDRAAQLAEALRDEPHRKLRHLSGWAGAFLAQVERARAEQTRQVIEAIEEAASHEAAHDYLSAIYALEAIPAALQSVTLPGARGSAARMISDLKGRQAETRRLEARVKEQVAAKKFDELLPAVESLLAHRPDRKDLQKLRVQLLERQQKQSEARDRVVESARANLAAQQFETALAALGTLPEAVVTPEVVKLREEAEGFLQQIRPLARRIRDAVAAKAWDGLLPVVERYLRLRPSDADAASVHKSLLERERRIYAIREAAAQEAAVPWRECRFADAAVAFEKVPEELRTEAIVDRITDCQQMAELRHECLSRFRLSLRDHSHGAALRESDAYAQLLRHHGLRDPDFDEAAAVANEALVAEAIAARRIVIARNTAIAAVALITTLLVVAGMWTGFSVGLRHHSKLKLASIVQEYGEQIKAAQIAADRSDGAARDSWLARIAELSKRQADSLARLLEYDPADATARISLAIAKLHASPPEPDAALGELERLTGADRGLAGVGSVRARALALRAVSHARADDPDKASQDVAEAKRSDATVQEIQAATEAIGSAWLVRAGRAATNGDGDSVRRLAEKAAASGADRIAMIGVWRDYVAGRIAKLDRKGVELACVEAKKAGLSDTEEAGWWMRFAETAEAPANAAIRQSVVAAYRAKFDTAIAGSDWDTALSAAAVAGQIDRSALEWLGSAISGRLSAVPPAALARLPATVIVGLPPVQNSVGISLKLLPAGRFTMGQSEGESDEAPHEVTLTKPFYIGVTEVTNAQWQAVMGSVPSRWQDPDRPVENVSWEEAQKFCRKLSALPEERRAVRVYRRPTEAEWEYACRAGSTTQYCFGDAESDLGDFGWFDGNSGGETHPVGEKKPNAWGLYDMHGNVWEWCGDWYGEYPRGAVTDPQGPSGGSYRVIRGGGWNLTARNCRSALRFRSDPSLRSNNLGFRLALSPSGAEPPEVGK